MPRSRDGCDPVFLEETARPTNDLQRPRRCGPFTSGRRDPGRDAGTPIWSFPSAIWRKTRIVPLATYGLIALNVVLYLVQVDHGPAFTTAYAATPYEITHDEDIPQPFILPLPGDENPLGLPGRVELKRRIIDQAPVPFPVWLTMVTAMFLHGSPLHLAGNMLYLWIFGDNVEEVLGTVRYLIVYLGCGLMGTLLQIAANPDSLIPTLGASGAIAGLMGAYVVWFPHNQVRVLVFRFITQMPAYLVIGGWILLQIWEGVGSVGQLGEVGGVAYLAHIGGAATGIGVALLFSERAHQFQVRDQASGGWFEGP